MTRDLRDRDLVISSSVAFCKAVRTRRDAIHVSYVYTPMRYAWDLDTYLAGSSLSLPGRTRGPHDPPGAASMGSDDREAGRRHRGHL